MIELKEFNGYYNVFYKYNMVKIGEIYREVDGEWKFWSESCSTWEESVLRSIADTLREMNIRDNGMLEFKNESLE